MAANVDVTYVTPEGLGLILLIVTFFFAVLTTIIIILRAMIRPMHGVFGNDDVLMITGWALFIVVVGVVSRGTYYGIGAKDDRLNDYLVEKSKMHIWLFQTFYCCSLVFIKSSICVTLLRIAVKRSHRIITGITLCVSFISSIIVIIGLFTMCRPIQANWDQSAGTCSPPIAITSLSYLTSAAAVVTDWVCAILPAFMIYKAQMKTATKVFVSIILGLGVLASIATIVRLPYIKYYSHLEDYPCTDVAPFFNSLTNMRTQTTSEISLSNPSLSREQVSSPARFTVCPDCSRAESISIPHMDTRQPMVHHTQEQVLGIEPRDSLTLWGIGIGSGPNAMRRKETLSVFSSEHCAMHILEDAEASDRRLIIISGPSGVDKDTLIQRLIDFHPGKFSLTVSHTTRKPRAGEVDGVSYHFVPEPVFSNLLDKDGFIEHAFFSGNYYGTSKDAIAYQRSQGSTPLLDIDIEGVKTITQSQSLDARYVFIRPPSLQALERRLRARGTEEEASMHERLVRAKAELDYADTSGVYDMVIVNDDLDEAFKRLEIFALGL
ncbi:hypothetical protein F53441_11447 [Fusarium austroafricanum]|uniref:guanylate kinase n=1 Tax=Fusarium austroafricanum TaxID=2364996 RepID=A0A8H4K5Z3_9HYPO|nr:hypothetical protein F53441_11447 [Fusarium austroafricanum]